MSDGRQAANPELPEPLGKYSADELEALKGVIDYSERMIFDEGQRHPYAALRRQAYSKTVVVQTELAGQQEFRLSPTPAVITPNRIGYATPHSPVGRLCTFLKVGDQGDSVAWGHYRIVETRLFQRYDGVEFERNVRNFLRMRVAGELIDGEVENLKGSLQRAQSRTSAPTATSVEDAAEKAVQISTGPELPAVTPTVVEVVRFSQVEEAEGISGEVDDTEIDAEAVGSRAGNYFGLNEIFYVDRTREQDQIMARSPVGPMFVEGVAGSGKTSAALGRTKMLCDFDARNVVSREDFESVVGQNGAYWEERFAGQFSQESSVGFVRTGELIQYLKETCRRLDLPNLPVLEFKELRTRLREHRQGSLRSGGTRRWAGTGELRDTTIDTTMQWLHATDRAVARVLSEELRGRLPATDELVDAFSAERRPVVMRIVEVAREHVAAAVEAIAEELDHAGPDSSGFALERVGARLLKAIADTRRTVLARDTVWAVVGNRSFNAPGERELAQRLVEARTALYLRSGTRLVWVGDEGRLDPELGLNDRAGQRVPWSEDVPKQLETNEVLVEDAEGRHFTGKAFGIDDLYLALLPEAITALYFLDGGTPKRLRVERGLGRLRLPLAADPKRAVEVAPDEVEQAAETSPTQEPPRVRSVDAAFGALLRRRLLGPLQDLAAMYRESLRRHQDAFPDVAVAEHIRGQLDEGMLTDHDIDLLLCLYQVIGRGLTRGAPAGLIEPAPFQSVFVDEVQDFTEQQVFLMAEQANPQYRAVTVVGDLAQKLHAGDSIDIRACFPGQAVEYVRLPDNLRQTDAPGLALFSACFRYVLQDKATVSPAVVTRARRSVAGPAGPQLVRCPSHQDIDAQILSDLEGVRAGETAAVLFPDPVSAQATFERLRTQLTRRMLDADLSHRVDLSRRFVRHFTSIENVKGLEFDVVIVCDVDAYDLQRAVHRNRLYVAITRPRRHLTLIHRNGEFDPGLRSVLEFFARLRGAHSKWN